MRNLEAIADSPFSVISDSIDAPKNGGNMYGWLLNCHGFWHNIGLIIPCVIFVLFLAFQAKKSFVKLLNGRSVVIIAYYGSVWIVSIFNLAWCLLQAWECTSAKETSWNVLSLFTDAGMLFLEVSLVAFLLQGNHANGKEALTRTFVISGLIVAFDMLLKAIYLYGFSIPLFIDDGENRNRVKWGLWAVHKLLLTAVYGIILFMYNSDWKERLPARPAFYKYAIIMFCLNVTASLACLLLTGHGFLFGSWLYSFTTICYHALYLPLLYVTFLADFFEEDDLHLESVYYSEMKDAGFFDADWEI
ncbi:transmembrane protein adipocyte-associated 1-like [Heracleum sosnowskyi]|uniref:Transmembrane protein adipocyte-associated 1-like n=1 Tax=Heracleum sosnowskyi TaxID=360622 RepID=A0AAD8M386_9APIA|nr:transmembrane protein adipocyte-associated 1-like [Heracleum sosnowskyi]